MMKMKTTISNRKINQYESFQHIIIDFDRIENMSDPFLKYTFDELCKYLNPKILHYYTSP